MRRTSLPAFIVMVSLITGGLFAVSPAAESAVPVWKIVASPNPAGSSNAGLIGVACPSPTNCFAVGSSDAKSLAEHWNGKTWAIQTTPNPTGSPGAGLSGVACPGPTSCFAVGSSGVATLGEHWNGKTWAVQTTPNPTGLPDAALSGVACATPTSCFAVGGTQDAKGSTGATLVEHWNGKTWAIQTTPNPTGLPDAVLIGVACPSPTSCFAVGTASDASSLTSLVEHWNGNTWALQTTPDLAPLPVALFGVACPSPTNCFAVGSAGIATLVEHWNGKTWALQASPNPSGFPVPLLIGVSCASPTNCSAVGLAEADPNSAPKTLALRWNGKTWAVQTTPNPTGLPGAVLSGVACPSPTSCNAVGQATNADGSAGKTLVERYA